MNRNLGPFYLLLVLNFAYFSLANKEGPLPPHDDNLTSLCEPLTWSKSLLLKKTIPNCWLNLGDTIINETNILITHAGSLWSRVPFELKNEANTPFSPGTAWKIETVFSIQPSQKSKGSVGNGIAFWLVTNSTIAHLPSINNWGVVEPDFTGLGVILDLDKERMRPARVLAVTGQNAPISLSALPTKCLLKYNINLLNQNMFLSISKGEQDITVTLLNSTSQQICQFPITIAKDDWTPDFKSWFHFGTSAFSPYPVNFEIKQISSENVEITTTPELVETTTPETEETTTFGPIIKRRGMAILIFGLIGMACGTILCLAIYLLVRARNRRRMRNKDSVYGPAITLMSPSSFVKPRRSNFFANQPSANQPFLQQPTTSNVERGSGGSRYVPESIASRRTNIISAGESTSPYASINVEDLPMVPEPSVTYMRPDSSRYMRSVSNENYDKSAPLMNDIADRLPYDKTKLELDPSKLRFLNEIGCGAFGIVSRAELAREQGENPRIVAVKQVRNPEDPVQRRTIECELRLLAHLGCHENIVLLIGAVTARTKDFCLVLEYCDGGNLKNFLHENKSRYVATDDVIDDVTKPVTRCHLITLALQIANGMEFIHSKRCVHRDLAARNILLCEGATKAKITDFGLAKDIYAEGMYQSFATTNKVPWPWYAPEFLQSCVYVPRSDVWSYGVLLWEILSLGERPYTGTELSNEFVRQLENGRRLEKPLCADEDLHTLMNFCWQFDANERPSFKMIKHDLSKWLNSKRKNVEN